MSSLAKQAGVALITALLVVALATVAAVSIASEYRFSVRRAENAIFNSQAWSYVKGVETWGKLILQRDRSENEIDHLNETWAAQIPALPVPGGHVSGALSDEQSKINLNNLINGNEVNEAESNRLRRLLSLIEVDTFLVDAIIDWIDSDLITFSSDGAEDEYYTSLEHPYLSANQPMAHISELRLVKGFNEETYLKVLPYVTALTNRTAINVNTASAKVIASLSPEIGMNAAEELVAERELTPYESVQEFQQALAEIGITLEPVDLSVSSSYFQLLAESSVGRSQANIRSLLQRVNENNVIILIRTQVN